MTEPDKVEKKGWAGDIESCAYQDFLTPGQDILPADQRRMRVDRWIHYHSPQCSHGCTETATSPSCYAHRLFLCLRNGLKTPWGDQGPPPAGHFTNYPNIQDFADPVTKELEKMLDFKALELVADPSTLTIISPLLVVIKDDDLRTAKDRGFIITNTESFNKYIDYLQLHDLKLIKIRVVVDLTKSGINGNIRDSPVAYVSAQDIISHMSPRTYFSIFDLERAYWQLPMAVEDRHYYGIRFPDGRYARFTSCPFGAKHSGMFQTIVTSQFCSFISNGIDTIALGYVDDIAVETDPDEEDEEKRLAFAKATGQKVIDIAKDIGLLMSIGKIHLALRIIEFIGIVFDAIGMKVGIDKKRALRLLDDLHQLTSGYNHRGAWCSIALSFPFNGEACINATVLSDAQAATKVRDLAATMTPAKIDDWTTFISRLSWVAGLSQSGKTRLAYIRHWINGSANATKAVVLDLSWWDAVLRRAACSNDEVIYFPSRLVTATSIATATAVISDASDTGYGFYIIDDISAPLPPPQDIPAFAYSFTAAERSDSSTVREAIAVRRFMTDMAHHYRGRVIIFITDSLALSLLLNSGSSKHIQKFIRPCMTIADRLDIGIISIHIPRDLNECADFISRLSSHPSCIPIRTSLLNILQPQATRPTVSTQTMAISSQQKASPSSSTARSEEIYHPNADNMDGPWQQQRHLKARPPLPEAMTIPSTSRMSMPSSWAPYSMQ